MRVIQSGRGGGKTTRIVEAFLASGPTSRLIVPTEIERARVIRQYQLKPDSAQRAIVAQPRALAGMHGEVFCDNADWVLSLFLGAAVDVATVNESLPAADAVDPVKPRSGDRDSNG